jgi:uncharacterized membrane protein (DUF4010 family)
MHTLFYRFGVALLIGLLVGLQRERAGDDDENNDISSAAGVRTFSLMALIGCGTAYVAELLGSPWAFVAILLPVGALLTVAYYITGARGSVGLTTEMAAVLIVIIGALCYWDELALAAALGVVTTALLTFKLELHGFAERLTREDVVAALKFAAITAIILPILPNQTFAPPPFDVLNPYEVWLMVVLISGISFLGYVLIKIVGPRQGIGLTGFLGGLASSTAVTLSFAQRSQRDRDLSGPFALAIIVAWVVMYGRVIVEVTVTNAPLLNVIWLPLLLTGGAGLLYSGYLYLKPGRADTEEVEVTNPFELVPAITFGLLFAVVLVVARAGQLYFGDAGVYVSSFISGLVDVDAIALSMSQLSRSGSVDLTTAGQAIILATLANTITKGGIVVASGSSAIRRTLLPGMVLMLVVGTLSLLLL